MLRIEGLLSTFVMGFAVSEARGRFTSRAVEVEADFNFVQDLVFEFIDQARARGQKRIARTRRERNGRR